MKQMAILLFKDAKRCVPITRIGNISKFNEDEPNIVIRVSFHLTDIQKLDLFLVKYDL